MQMLQNSKLRPAHVNRSIDRNERTSCHGPLQNSNCHTARFHVLRLVTASKLATTETCGGWIQQHVPVFHQTLQKAASHPAWLEKSARRWPANLALRLRSWMKTAFGRAKSRADVAVCRRRRDLAIDHLEIAYTAARAINFQTVSISFRKPSGSAGRSKLVPQKGNNALTT